MLSEHHLQIMQDNNINHSKIHHQNLKVYLKLGLQLRKIIEYYNSNKNQF